MDLSFSHVIGRR